MTTLSMAPEELDDEPTGPSALEEAEQNYGRYRLCFELASGGMGKVFLARAEGAAGFEKLVALKRIHPHLAKQRQFVDMFLDEARIASKISHPNVCSVFDFGEQDGTFYIAMEYLVGEPLSRVMTAMSRHPTGGGPRRRLFAARIVADACEGLHAAHELRDPRGTLLNVVHRDVSPHNLFVTYNGSVRVVDFGIARAADQVHDTTTGSVKGKWTYMSPEQARGKHLDRRADVWSLGVVLWELFTQRRLFQRTSQTETVIAVVEDPIPAPSEVDPTIPKELDEMVLKALNRDRELRQPSARALGRDLLRFLGGQGDPIGMPDLAEWMEEMFPAAHARKSQLVEIARQPRSVPSIAGTPSDELSGVRPGPFADDGASGGDDTIAAPSPFADRTEEAPRRRGWIAAVVGATVLAGGAVLVGSFAGWAAGEEASVAEPNLPATEEPPAEVVPVEARSESPPVPEDGESMPPPDESVPTEAPSDQSATVDRVAPEETTAETPGATTEDPAEDVESPASEVPGTVDRPSLEEPVATMAEERTAPEVVGRGSVNVVTTNGWASVHWRGRRLASETPAVLTLPEGRQVLTIRPQGESPGIRRRVRVRPNQTHRLVVNLP
ncbi:MAG: protein kinase [Myxococcota bacterium]